MAQIVRKSQWLAIEESLARDAYWNLLVDGWLWKIPCAITARDSEQEETLRQAGAPLALRNYGWVKEPQSAVSH